MSECGYKRPPSVAAERHQDKSRIAMQQRLLRPQVIEQLIHQLRPPLRADSSRAVAFEIATDTVRLFFVVATQRRIEGWGGHVSFGASRYHPRTLGLGLQPISRRPCLSRCGRQLHCVESGEELQNCLMNSELLVQKQPTRRLRWRSVSGGCSRNTGFSEPCEIQTIYARYCAALSITEDTAAGREIFNLERLNCHRAGQPHQPLAGLGQVNFRLGKAESQQVFAASSLEERLSRYARHAGHLEQVHRPFDAARARGPLTHPPARSRRPPARSAPFRPAASASQIICALVLVLLNQLRVKRVRQCLESRRGTVLQGRRSAHVGQIVEVIDGRRPSRRRVQIPQRQPVMLKTFENPEIRIVRSATPGREPGLMCRCPS